MSRFATILYKSLRSNTKVLRFEIFLWYNKFMKLKKRYQLPGIMLALVGVAIGVFGAVISPIVSASSTGGSLVDGGLIFIIAGIVLIVGSIITVIVLVS